MFVIYLFMWTNIIPPSIRGIFMSTDRKVLELFILCYYVCNLSISDDQHNSTIHTLSISDNRLGSVGIIHITDALKENRSLTDLV